MHLGSPVDGALLESSLIKQKIPEDKNNGNRGPLISLFFYDFHYIFGSITKFAAYVETKNVIWYYYYYY